MWGNRKLSGEIAGRSDVPFLGFLVLPPPPALVRFAPFGGMDPAWHEGAVGFHGGGFEWIGF